MAFSQRDASFHIFSDEGWSYVTAVVDLFSHAVEMVTPIGT
jgi:hypothetical protein